MTENKSYLNDNDLINDFEMEDMRSTSWPPPTQKMQTKFGKLKLLMWKNAIQRRRHWLLFLLELVIPIGLMCLACYMRIIPKKDFVPEYVTENTIYQRKYESHFRRDFCISSFGYWQYQEYPRGKCIYEPSNSNSSELFRIYWGPSTSFTKQIIQYLQDDLNILDNIFEEVSSNEELNARIDESYIAFSSGSHPFFVGIFFDVDQDYTKYFSYDLRLQKIWYTYLVYPYFQIGGPRDSTLFSSVASYTSNHFVFIQALIDRIYISLMSNDSTILNNHEIVTEMFPYPPYLDDKGLNEIYGRFLPFFVVFALVLLSPTLIKGIVHEKETGVRELIRLMGMESWLNWIGWFMYSFVGMFIISIVVVMFLKIEITSSDYPDEKIPAVLPKTGVFLLWVFIIVYGISAIAFCMAISCFFTKPSLATTIGVLAWILSYYIPYSIMDVEYNSIGLLPKMLSCLLPNTALTWFFKIVAMFEGRGSGVRWDNLWESGNAEDKLTPGLILIMLLFDIFLFFLITWYVDQVMPGDYGVPLPWNFPFKRSYYVGTVQMSPPKNYILEKDRTNFEPEPEGLSTGIRIQNLRKEFKTSKNTVKVAVDDVSLSCYKGQCTVLLGHNGAGKTTTMSVLTGVYKPTSGYADINGWNISTDLKNARSQVGLCPQHNTLFVDLSVKEHLIFFARLKGLTSKEAKEDTKRLLAKLKLTEKKNNFGKMLSGGMKRKLCLAIALIGNSQIVILDEPSSGLDPESRRWVWEVLQQERTQRTILVTTHHMEEADVLGDRIAIMAKGKVVCCGSSLFLKKTFGEGYTLAITKATNNNTEGISKIIQTHLSSSYLKNEEGSTLFYILPPITSEFPCILDELTEKKDEYGIYHLSLYLTSIEQVFLRVADINKDTSDTSSESTKPISTEDLEHQKDDRLIGFALIWRRFLALMKKKVIYSKRKWLLLVTQGLIPLAVTLLCLLVDASFHEEDYAEPTRNLTLNMFDETYSFIKPGSTIFDSPYEMLFKDNNFINETDNLEETLLEAANEDLTLYRENYITTAYFEALGNKTVSQMMYQSIPYHCPGVGMNLIGNAILHAYTGDSSQYISTSNYPLPKDKAYLLDDDQSSYSSSLYALTMPIALAFLTSSFLVFPLNERVSQAKQIQVMTGTSSFALWATSYLWDMISYSITILLIFICFMAFDTKDFFNIVGARGSLFLLLFLYGFGSIPMAYVFSFLFENSASGFSVLALINIFSGMIMSFVVYTLNISGVDKAASILNAILSFIPTYGAAKGFRNIVDMESYNTQCEIISTEAQVEFCDFLFSNNIDSLYNPCCPQCEETGNCFEILGYFTWKYPGMGVPLLSLFLDAFFYSIILFLLDQGFLAKARAARAGFLRKVIESPQMISKKTLQGDTDALKEENYARHLIQEMDSDAAIVVNNLKKVFIKSGLVAVNGIGFHVKRGECLGLLGVNGAGKTTTFRLLTGDETPSSGDARIGRNFLTKNKRAFLRDVGYCPQFDAIIGELSGEEMLELMAGLRGVPISNCKKLVHETIVKMDLTECYKRPCQTYSGGNKRKLSTGMALIGKPPLVFLDEPTSGVDPASRRKVWEAVQSAIRSKESVILTSHSMDECEALCNRVIIMAQGTLMCAGSPQHLKFKYGNGYTVQIKIRTYFNNTHNVKRNYNSLVHLLKVTMKKSFPDSEIADEHRGMITFKLSGHHTWSSIFEIMESLKTGNESSKFQLLDSQSSSDLSQFIEDYAVMDPSLEQVFLSFARNAQHSE